MPSHRFQASCALVAALVFGIVRSAGAAAAIQPLPEPDFTGLSPEARAALVETRRQFDAVRPSLVGPQLAEAFARLGTLSAQQGDLRTARAALANATAVTPEDGRFVYLLGVYTAAGGDKARALALYREALALEDDYLPIRYRLAALQLELGDFAGVRATIGDVAEQREDLAPPAALMGELALREKRWPDAERWFARALEAEPAAITLHARRAEALVGLGRRAEAEAARAKAGPFELQYADPLVDGEFAPQPIPVTARALALAAEGRHGDAVALLDAALAQAPDSAELLAAYARVEADRGDLQAAARRADAALRIAPASAEALVVGGMVDEMAGRADAARARYEAAVRADLESRAARLALGNDAMRRGLHAQAAEQYRQLVVLEARSESDTGLARLAAALALAGRCAEALRETNASLAQRPRDGGAMQVFVRVAATCPSATAEERAMAADYGQALYRQRPDEAHAEALAMAMAAIGRKDEAIDYQAQAIFEALKRKDPAAVDRLKAGLARFQAGEAATRPWPAGHPFTDPPPLAKPVRAPAR